MKLVSSENSFSTREGICEFMERLTGDQYSSEERAKAALGNISVKSFHSLYGSKALEEAISILRSHG